MKMFKYLMLISSISFATLFPSLDNGNFFELISNLISVPKTYSNEINSLQIIYDTVKVKRHTRIGNDSAIINFYRKLELLKKGKLDSLKIFHMGDSHIKGKFFTGTIQDEFDKNYNGIKYKTFGINGASYKTFCDKIEYLDEIEKLKPDLIIISLGTNDASGDTVLFNDFLNDVHEVISSIRDVKPDADILITTPPDYIKKGEINNNIPLICNYLFIYCDDNDIAYWDLYGAMGGKGSCLRWIEDDLMAKDKIHFTKEGYEIQALMFYDDLMYVGYQ